MRQRLTGGQRGLVSAQVRQPEHLQHPGDDGGAVDPGEPEQMTNQHGQQDRRQGICRGNQRFKDRHNGLRDQHTKLRLNHQAQRIKGHHHHQHRDQQIKRVFDHRRDLVRQTNADVMRFEETHHLNAVDRHQNRGKNARSPQTVDRERAFGFWCRDQQKRHQRQHGAHKGVQLMRFDVVFAKVIGNGGTDINGHDAHRHIKRRQDLAFKLLRHIQPGAGETPGGIRRKRWVSKD